MVEEFRIETKSLSLSSQEAKKKNLGRREKVKGRNEQQNETEKEGNWEKGMEYWRESKKERNA